MSVIDLGKLRLTNRGVYNVATAYEVDDIVQHTDAGVLSTYICKAASTGNAPASGGTVHASWQLMARGTDAVGMSFPAFKNSSFNADGGTGYTVDTSAAAITITLPASPSTGDLIKIIDYGRTFHTNHCTLAANGNKIEHNTDDFVLTSKGLSLEMLYDSDTGTSTPTWRFINWVAEDDTGLAGNKLGRGQSSKGVGSKKYIVATSDAHDIYMDGDDMVHRFTESGTFRVHSLGSDSTYGTFIEYLMCGGGGSGGTHHAGGGGAGGYRANNAMDYAVTVQDYTVTVGTGGSQRNQGNNHGNKGGDTEFDGMNSEGGGGGAAGSHPGQPGGSGGGGGHSSGHGPATGNGDGHRGGNHQNHTGSGGGGASHFGSNIHGDHSPGHGGRGKDNDITGIKLWYCEGGGGTGHHYTSTGEAGGHTGGGAEGQCAQDRSGSGGGGTQGTTGNHQYGGRGGDGVCVIRYRCRDGV
jgi:hypothetical protein